MKNAAPCDCCGEPAVTQIPSIATERQFEVCAGCRDAVVYRFPEVAPDDDPTNPAPPDVFATLRCPKHGKDCKAKRITIGDRVKAGLPLKVSGTPAVPAVNTPATAPVAPETE